GEAQVVVISANSPSNCFSAVYEACRIAIEHMTPVFFLSDGYMANGSEPWAFPNEQSLNPIKVKYATETNSENGFLPYKRDEKLARPWAIPGTPKLQHRVGGIEKQHETGNVSYDPQNHEFMVKLRAEKIKKIENYIP